METRFQVLNKIFKQEDLSNANDKGFVSVRCIFHNDTTKSAAININDGFFTCFTCDIRYQYKTLVSKVYPKQVLDNLDKAVTDFNWDNHFRLLGSPVLESVKKLGISQDALIQFKIGLTENNYLAIPIFMEDMFLGNKYYHPAPPVNCSKTFSDKGLSNGLIIGFNEWVQSNKDYVVICEGEKDWLVAQSQGINAICLSGGAKALPKGFEAYFSQKKVYIIYDNDDAGRDGAIKLANHLWKNHIRQIKIVTSCFDGFQDKEDLTDYFTKYNKTNQELLISINNSKWFSEEDYEQYINKKTPLIHLFEAYSPKYITKLVRSNIQVRAMLDNVKSVPREFSIIFMDKKSDDFIGQHDFSITSENLEVGIYYCYQKNFLKDHLKQYALKIYQEQFFEKTNIKFTKTNIEWSVFPKEDAEYQPIYTQVIMNYADSEVLNTGEEIDDTASLTLYSLVPLKSSGIYTITYRTFASAVKQQQTLLILHDRKTSTSSFRNYKLTDQSKQRLIKFNGYGDIEQRVNHLYTVAKNKWINHLNFDLWLATELTFCSVSKMIIANKLYRGMIYTNIIGDTRVGKSEIARKLVEVYEQGKFINAKLSTVLSLTGGATKINGENAIVAGALPRSNGTMVVLEELHGLGNDYFKQITDVKSSNQVSIERVAGSLKLECAVRLLEISNPKGSEETTTTVRDFPNAIKTIQSLIKAPEDIARNDLYIIVAKSAYISPYDIDTSFVTNLEHADYQERIRWIWSRDERQIIFEDERYIWDTAQKLNAKYDCDGLSILGAEANLKLARMAAALSGMLAITKDDFKSIYVPNSAVNFVANWLDKMYSSELMGIDKYVIELKEYSVVTDEDVKTLQNIYKDWASALNHLRHVQETNKDILIQFSGKPQSETGLLFAQLQHGKFIRQTGTNKIIPSLKFREAIKKIQENVGGF